MTDRCQRRRADQTDSSTDTASDETNYRPPKMVDHGPLGELVRGASWKGVDSVGELQPDDSYPG